MTAKTSYEPGQFCWVDLATTDQKAAENFYCDLFGWTVVESPVPQGGHYTMFMKNGAPVAGDGQLSDEMIAGGMPSVWNSYVQTDDVDKTVERATALGAQIAVPPMDAMDTGRLAFVADPTGAMFGLWQPKSHHGAALCNEPGTFCWNELTSRDIDSAKGFYGELFGWTFVEQQSATPAGNNYIEIRNDGKPNGGIMGFPPGMPEGIPNYWGMYIAVDDTDSTMERIKELGGQCITDAMDIPAGRFAVVLDPTGAAFTIIKLNHAD